MVKIGMWKGKKDFPASRDRENLILAFRGTLWFWWFYIGDMEEFCPGSRCYGGDIMGIHGKAFYGTCLHAGIAHVATEPVNLPGLFFWFHPYCLARALFLAYPARNAFAHIDYHMSP